MNPMKMMMLATLAMLTADLGCTSDEPQPACGAQGELVTHQSQNYCVYQSSITETGFSCPSEVPNLFDQGPISVCGPEADAAMDILVAVAQKAPPAWTQNNTTTNNSTTNNSANVGQNISFTTCDAIEKTTEYCAAERLEWSYDAASKKLRVDNTRVALNCCGERTMQVIKDSGQARYTLMQVDDPEVIDPETGETARCNCMCVFEFGADIPEVEEGSVTIAIERKISDQDFQEVVFEQVLDLNANAGSEIVEEGETFACMPE